ncbi:MAG TPA: hypothetical protein VF247_11170 [Candidatus Krumholzibacteria bacterium]
MHYRVLLLAASFFASLATPSNACQCPIPSPGSAIGSARLIFAAHVIGGGRRDGFRVRVLAVWKGDLPESTTVRPTGMCGYRIEPERDYLFYFHSASDSASHSVGMCSGSRPLEYAHLDRYLLGEPVVRYDDSYRPVTLDSMLDLITQPDGELFAPAFSDFRIESALLVPRLRRMVRGETLGNKLAAVRAIDELGTTAPDAYSDLRDLYEYLTKKDPELHAAALSAMLSVNRDYQQNREYILEAMDDDDPAVRSVIIRCLYDMKNRDYAEVRRIAWRGLEDADLKIRVSTIQACSYGDLSPETARKIKHVADADPNLEVFHAATQYFEWRDRYMQQHTKGTDTKRGLKRRNSP